MIWLVAAALAGDGGFDHEHALFDAFLDGAVDDRGVDYALLATRRHQLDPYLEDLATAPVATFTAPQQLAFWIDAYNALTLVTVLDAMPLASIRDLDGGKVWDAREFRVAGASLTLNQIEHERVRKLGDARIHAVVNCAAKGCPPLPPDPIVASRLEAQLDAASRRWVATNAYEVVGESVQLSQIFDWYGEDFVAWAAGRGDIPKAEGKAEAALWFLVAYADDAARSRRLADGALTPAWRTYDWALNAR